MADARYVGYVDTVVWDRCPRKSVIGDEDHYIPAEGDDLGNSLVQRNLGLVLGKYLFGIEIAYGEC